MRLLGVLLAGGGSRRFGSAKALARLHGTPLWSLGLAALEPCDCGVVAVTNDPDVAAALPVPVRSDLRPGLGPLAGLETALAWAREEGAEGAVIVGCDMPWLGPAPVAALVARWDGSAPVVIRGGTPWGFEPLCAAVPVSDLAEVERRLAGGVLELGGALAAMEPTLLDPEPGWSRRFRSVDRRADLPPPVVAVVGNKKSGKTTIAVALIRELVRRGRRVRSVKHGHHFEVDKPGADSWRHRYEGGAESVVLAGPEGFAFMGDWAEDGEPDLEDLVLRFLPGAELVVAEGYRHSAVPKIEIQRFQAQPEPAIDPKEASAADVFLRVTDRPDPSSPIPSLDADADDLVARLADAVEERLFG